MDYREVKRYLEGKTSLTESQLVREWLKDPQNDNKARGILGQIWRTSEIRVTGNQPDFEQMLNLVHSQMEEQRSNQEVNKKQHAIFNSRLYVLFSRVAAILILPVLLLSVYFYFNPRYSNAFLSSNSIREIYTKPGTRTKIELSDGTTVWLNDGTTFRYPEKFTGDRREVFVDGEAYFEVAKNPKIPFVVDNSMMKTIVTGTHFNLNAYSADHFFEATLLEGKVSLEKGSQTIGISPGEQIQFNSTDETIVKNTVIAENAAAWVHGKLIFKDEKLNTAIKKLARWYNVEILMNDNELENYVISGTIQDEKLDQTLNLISLALPVKFEFKKVDKPTEIQRTIIMMKK